MERQTGSLMSGFLYGDAGYTRKVFDETTSGVYLMQPGDNVLHLVVNREAIVYLPAAVKGTDGYYLITSSKDSTQNVAIMNNELDQTIVTLAPCTTVLLITNGHVWYEVALTLKP